MNKALKKALKKVLNLKSNKKVLSILLKKVNLLKEGLKKSALSQKSELNKVYLLWLIWLKVKLCIKINLYDNSWSLDYFD